MQLKNLFNSPGSADDHDRLAVPSEHGVMSFGDHLEELRRRIFLALVVPVPLMMLLFLFSNTLLIWLLLPLYRTLEDRGLSTRLQELAPPELLLTKLKISIIAAIVLSAPWIIWQFWLFIKPGLYKREQRFVYFLMPGSVFFTLAGVALMYWVMLPLMLQFMVGIGQSMNMRGSDVEIPPAVATILESTNDIPVRYSDPATPESGQVWQLWDDDELHVAWTNDGAIEVFEIRPGQEYGIAQQYQVSKTINFILLLFLAITIAFQLPLVLLLLGWLELASPEWLRAQRRYALLGTGLACAIITPPDILSMVMMMVPLYGLYELGILMIEYIPASRVAGGLLGGDRHQASTSPDESENADSEPDRADKRASTSAEPVKPVQPESTIPRSKRQTDVQPESDDSATDDPGAGS